jgi:hypothetical protein
MADTKCARCGKPRLYFTLALWMGPQGFRRYKLCDRCKAEVERKRSTKKGAIPLVPLRPAGASPHFQDRKMEGEEVDDEG